MEKFINYIKEVKVELKRTNWLSRHEALKYTFIVIFISILFAALFALLDLIFFKLLTQLL